MRGGRYLVALAGLGVLAAGCGTQVAQPGNLAAAVSATAGRTARIAETMAMRAPGMSMSFTATGAFDFARSRGMISMRYPMGMTELFIPPKAYIKLPAGAGAGLPPGKSWLAIDAGAAGSPAGSLFGPFGGGTDPADLLSSLTAMSSSVTRLGTATIRGVQVTGYRVTIDPAKAAARLPRAKRAGFRDFATMLGSGSIPVDVWVDGQNLVRRVQLSLHLPGGQGAPAHARFVQTTDFYDFGAPVHVSAPPAAQVASMSQLMTGGSSGRSFSSTGGGSASPPKVAGTLSPAQTAAAEQAASTFWSALERHDPAAAAQAVPAGQRTCVRSFLSSGPKITVSSFRIVSAQPAGNGRAVVRVRVKGHASIGGHDFPVFQGPGSGQWLLATDTGGHWYVDLARSGGFAFGGVCP